ncbi:MAG TPA: hypothetical protein VL426_07345 [Candidatus Binatia bacterium]|nr:hypothetical protein [Candidatus Binatia bacterium]
MTGQDRIFATIPDDDRLLLDGATPERECVSVPPGRYELERVPNPYGPGRPWLVLKGSRIGMVERGWHLSIPLEIVIEA